MNSDLQIKFVFLYIAYYEITSDIKIAFILNQHCVPYIIFCSILKAA